MFTQRMKRLFPAKQTMKQNQGVYWKKGALEECYIIFRDGRTGFCIGSAEIDGPSLLVKSNSYFYLCVQSANNGCPNDYFVVEDFDGPVKLRNSGYIYDFGDQCIQLL